MSLIHCSTSYHNDGHVSASNPISLIIIMVLYPNPTLSFTDCSYSSMYTSLLTDAS